MSRSPGFWVLMGIVAASGVLLMVAGVVSRRRDLRARKQPAPPSADLYWRHPEYSASPRLRWTAELRAEIDGIEREMGEGGWPLSSVRWWLELAVLGFGGLSVLHGIVRTARMFLPRRHRDVPDCRCRACRLLAEHYDQAIRNVADDRDRGAA